MTRAERLRLAWKARGYRTARAVAAALNMNETTFSDIVRGKTKTVDDGAKDAIARLLDINPTALWFGSDEDFIGALEGVEPEPAGGHGGGIVRSFRLDSAIVGDGLVEGAITYQAIKDPTGKGARIKHPQNWRGDPSADAKTRRVELPGVTPGFEVVEVRTRLTLPEEEDVLPPGYLLIVEPTTNATPQPRQIVLAKKDLADPMADIADDAPDDEGLAQVRIFQYNRNRGHDLLWPLAGGHVADMADGWEIIGIVRWWRPPP